MRVNQWLVLVWLAVLVVSCTKRYADGLDVVHYIKPEDGSWLAARLDRNEWWNDRSPHTRSITEHFSINDSNGHPLLYIYNYKGDSGFVMLSARVDRLPVIAYVSSGRFAADTVPAPMVEYMHGLQNVSNTTIGGQRHAANQWELLLNRLVYSDTGSIRKLLPETINDPCGSTMNITKGPYVKTEWGQRCSFNEACPATNCVSNCNSNSLTGCVATAMGQLIRYFETPSGYPFANMSSSFGNTAVQQLLFDAAKSVATQFGCASSSALFDDIPQALLAFGVQSTMSNVNANTYFFIKSKLNNSKPLILGGCASRKKFLWWSSYDQCHAWICDGYLSTDNGCSSSLYLHMNWGWNEVGAVSNYNGWYGFTYWKPTQNFYQFSQQMVGLN